MQLTGESTIGEIVAGDFRTAAVFEEFGGLPPALSAAALLASTMVLQETRRSGVF